MEATYDALCLHGYAELSIKKIADEFGRGKSLIYYHYEDREDLMLSFLEFMKSNLEEGHLEISDLKPEKRLDILLEKGLSIEDEEMWEFRKALMEMRAQTPHSEEFSRKFEEIDELVLEKYKSVLDDLGFEEPANEAEFLFSTVEGYMTRKISYGSREGLEEFREHLKSLYLK